MVKKQRPKQTLPLPPQNTYFVGVESADVVADAAAVAVAVRVAAADAADAAARAVELAAVLVLKEAARLAVVVAKDHPAPTTGRRHLQTAASLVGEPTNQITRL